MIATDSPFCLNKKMQTNSLAMQKEFSRTEYPTQDETFMILANPHM